MITSLTRPVEATGANSPLLRRSSSAWGDCLGDHLTFASPRGLADVSEHRAFDDRAVIEPWIYSGSELEGPLPGRSCPPVGARIQPRRPPSINP